MYGFRITGMAVWNEKRSDYDRYYKTWGMRIKSEEVNDSLLLFFKNGGLRVMEQFLIKTKMLLEFFENDCSLKFVSSSLLFLYDCNNTVDLKLIDFAHVSETVAGGDQNIIFGLQQLVRVMQELIDAV